MAQQPVSGVRLSDGSFDFVIGANSGCVTTVQSAFTPHGLKRSENAWLTNCTVRSGGITCRTGWKPLVNITEITALAYAQGATGLWQGGWLYDAGYANPYLVCSIGGRIYKVDLDAPYGLMDLSTLFGLVNPSTPEEAFFCQGEEFLVIQAGDYGGQYGVGQVPPVNAGTGTLPGGFSVPATDSIITLTLNAPYTGVVGDHIQIHLDSPNFDLVGIVTYINGNDLTYIVKPSLIQPLGLAIPGTFVIWIFNKVITGNPTLPLFWDGAKLWRSKGITTSTPADMNPGINELPAATSMDYYMGRIWYGQGRTVSAGDIVKGTSGTAHYSFRDSILNVTENPMCFGGDGFTLPSNAGNIRGIKHTNSTNGALGEGDLYIGTRRSIYKLVVPVTRSEWIAADSNNQPKMTVAQGRGGFYGDRCVVKENSDLFYASPSGRFRSLKLTIQNDDAWGNTGIGNNEERIFPFEDKGLLHLASGISFDNRILQTCLPVITSAGAAFEGIVPLDLDLITTLQEKLPPAWEGIYEGLKFLQLFEGDFGGKQRAFATIVSKLDDSIQIYELTDDTRFDDPDNVDGDKRITWAVETPAWTWGNEMKLKELDGLELWIDKLFGTVEITVEWRPDADACWHFWERKIICSAKSSCEDMVNPVCYPEQPYAEGQRFPVVFGCPPSTSCVSSNKRPANIGFQHQLRITIKGWCRIRGHVVWALPFNRAPFEGLGG